MKDMDMCKMRIEEKIFIGYLSKLTDLNVVDVGGNIGDYSQLIIDNVSLNKLIIIEPIDSCYEKLEKRFGGISYVSLVNELVSDVVEDVIFHEVVGNEVHSSIVNRDWLYNKSGYDYEIRENTITTKKLDNLIDGKIDFLKIDTEGHELQVLKGAEKLLSYKKIKYIQFEYGGCFKDNGVILNDVIEYLNKLDYKVYEITESEVTELVDYKDDYKWVNFFASYEEIKIK